jgi:hypothetical protein
MDASRPLAGLPALERIAALLDDHVGDASSGHERWRFYRRAIDLPGSWTDLLNAIKYEPDPSIASAVVVQLLERVPAEMRPTVVDVLGDGKEHDFVAARSRELEILESLLASAYDAQIVHSRFASWSTWLQLRVAAEVGDQRILGQLAQSGRTKRVRSVAARRLRSGKPG